MKDEHGAQRACENKKPLIDGRRANVQLAYLGAKKKTKDGIVFSKTSLNTWIFVFVIQQSVLHTLEPNRNSLHCERICIASGS